MVRFSKRSYLLLFCDLCAIIFAWYFAAFFGPDVWANYFTYAPVFYLTILIFPVFFYIFDLYFPFKYFNLLQTIVDVLVSILGAVLLTFAIAYSDKNFRVSRAAFFYASVFLVPLIVAVRIFYDGLFRSRVLDKKTIILGAGPTAQEIAKIILATPYSTIELLGFVALSKKESEKNKMNPPVLGDLAKLASLLDTLPVQMVIVAFEADEDPREIIPLFFKRGILATTFLYLYEKLAEEIPYQLLSSEFLLTLMAQVRSRTYLKIKRLTDIVFGPLLFLVTLPVLLLAILLMAIFDPGPVFFVQERIGLDGRPFMLYKLRSMRGHRTKRKKRVTSLGFWLRKYRIDEIPQLLNVIKGDMHLIGPRPEMPHFVRRSRLKIPYYDIILTVKPGLTGWAQVKFRYTTTVKDYDFKFRYNLFYLKNVSFRLDLLIILKTIRVVLLGRGK